MDKHIANQVAKKYLRKLCLDYPSVGSLISGDEWAEGIIERAILEAFQQCLQPTACNVRASNTSTNYVVAKFGGG